MLYEVITPSGGKMPVRDAGRLNRAPRIFYPLEPSALNLIEHEQRLVADLGEFGPPAGTAGHRSSYNFV